MGATELNKNPLDNFSGWLFYLFIVFIISPFALIFSCIPMLRNITTSPDLLGAIINAIMLVFAYVKLLLEITIIKIFRKKEPTIPDQIVKFNFWLIIIMFFESVILVGFYCFESDFNNVANVARILLQYLIGFSIWTAYFKKSKRVLAYYGQNLTRVRLID